MPDKKDIRLVDYVDSLKKTAVPGTFNVKGDPSSRPMPDALLPETGFFVELQQARTESQTRFHLPHPHRWLHAKQQTLEHIAKLCRQVLGIDLSQLAPSAALPLAASTNEIPAFVNSSQTAHRTFIPRYHCVGSADIRLPRWGHLEKCTVSNLSIGGCKVKSNFAFEVGEEIELTLLVNKMSFRAAGRVVHVPSKLNAAGPTSELGVGVQFKLMTSGARDRLQDLIAELKTKEIRRH